MPLDIDPIFHTETMVRILREQGSTLYAMELAELIMAKDPKNDSVAQILEELKGDARSSFERFQKGGQAAQAARVKTKLDELEARETERDAPAALLKGSSQKVETPVEGSPAPTVSEPPGEAIAEVVPLNPRSEVPATKETGKVRKLKSLLKNIQKLRGSHDSV